MPAMVSSLIMRAPEEVTSFSLCCYGDAFCIVTKVTLSMVMSLEGGGGEKWKEESEKGVSGVLIF